MAPVAPFDRAARGLDDARDDLRIGRCHPYPMRVIVHGRAEQAQRRRRRRSEQERRK